LAKKFKEEGSVKEEQRPHPPTEQFPEAAEALCVAIQCSPNKSRNAVHEYGMF
jgi:hypothetical protein